MPSSIAVKRYGLVLAAVVSLGLWAAIFWLAAQLIG